MCGVQADVPDRDIRIDGFKFPKGNDGADTVVPFGIQETDMEWEVKADLRIMGAEHIKGVAKIKDFFIAVPAPVSVWVREMPSAGTMGYAVFRTFTDLMPIRGSVGMDTSAVAGKSEAVRRDESVIQGGQDGGEAEELLEPFLIMEGEGIMFQGVSGQGVSNAGMLIRKLLSFAGLFRRLRVLILWEKILPAGFLGIFGLCPEACP